MYNYYTTGEIQLHAFTNMGYYLTIYYVTENEQLFPKVLSHRCVYVTQ